MLQPVMSASQVSAFWDEHFPQVQAPRDIAILAIEPGMAVLRLSPDERHLRPGGTISGPALFTLADVGAYAVLLAHVGPEPLIVTTNLSINFMRRAPVAPLLGRCRILKLGKRLAVVEIAIVAESGGDLIAHATGTYSIPSHGNMLPSG
jgi:uncharacterized protein (TIGR00369 family)